MTSYCGATMDDPSNLPSGIGGLIGLASAAIVGAILWLRRFLSKDATDRSADTAYRSLIEDLRQQIELERARNKELSDSRDAAVEQISGLRQQVSDLSDQVAKLQRQLAALQPIVTPR